MPVMLERWNDDKMDALDAKVNAVEVKVNRVDAKVDAVVAELREQRQEMRELQQETKAGFQRIHRLLFQFCGVAIAALIGLIATQI